MDGDDWLINRRALQFATRAAQKYRLNILRVPFRSDKFQYDYFSMVWQYVLYRDFVKDDRFPSIQPCEDDVYMDAILRRVGADRYSYLNLPHLSTPLYYYNYLEDGEIPEHRYNGYFNAIPEQVWDAKYELNRTFRFRCAHSKNGYVTLNEFFKLLGREPIECGDNLGWSEDLATEYYGYIWIDIKIDEVTLEDGMVVNVITTPFPPTILA